ncbi:Phosphoprotein phosphatase [Bertholletia excelsa]
MVNWLGKRKGTNVQYVGGCLIFLQIWSYEHIDIGRPNLVDFPVMFPRACRWGNSRSHQRRWFSEKFQELEMNQIIWKLQLNSEESKIDMIEELLEEQCDNEDLPAWRNNVMTDKEVIRYRLQIMDQWIAEMANESDVDTVKDDVSLEDSGKKLGIVQNIPMEPINNVNILSTSHNISDVQQEQIEHPRKSLESSTLIISSDEDNVDNVEARYQLLHKQTQKLEGEIDHLKKENKVLKDQLSSKSTFEEQNRKLRKEMEHLREENKDFNNLLARLERHLCDVNVNGVEHCLESIVKGGFGNEGTGLHSSRQQDNDISALI